MKWIIILVLVALAAACYGFTPAGATRVAAGTSDDGIDLGYKAANVSVKAGEADAGIAFYADGVRISPKATLLGDSDETIPIDSGDWANFTGVFADSVYYDRASSTDIIIVWE